MVKKTWIFLLGLGLLASTSCWAIEIDVAEAPTSDLELTVSAIQSANSKLLVNIYDLSSPQIADALINRIQAGVHVEILEEGQPVGGLSTAARGIQAQLSQAMSAARNGDRLYEMTSKAGGKRRFRYDHAKYIVIDDSAVLIGSENYSPTGNPTPGSLGNRGWEVLVHDAALAQDFTGTFQEDAVTSYNDVLDLTSNATYALNIPRKNPRAPQAPRPGAISSPGSLQALSVSRVTAPTTSESGLVALVNSARRTLDIEQMSFDPTWKTGSSPLYDAVVAAARRGVQVRLLLNDERVFDHPSHPSKPKNRVTDANFNQLAQSERLNASSRIANLKAMGVDYIHNKGVLVDGNQTLVSSINWGENSVMNNRETAIVIDSTAINAHYKALFDQDWQASAGAATDLPNPTNNPEGLENVMFMPGMFMSAMTDATKPPPAFDCPTELTLSIQVGDLVIKDDNDVDFQTIANKKITGTFTHSKSQNGCILTQKGMETSGTSNRKTLELRALKTGELTVTLEGYTPKTEKIYSIRARLESADEIEGTWDAKVYQGSGTREQLGAAEMTISE